MKTIPRHLKAVSLVLISVLTAPFALAQVPPSENSSGAISVDRSAHYTQTDYGQVTLQQTPYNFTFHVRGGSESLKTNWGPKFYKAGSGGTAQSGSSSATNTGTLNFPSAPNNGSDFMFLHEFDTDAAMLSFYPIAPTGGGQYGVNFTGSGAPAPSFTDGLVFAAGITYPAATPQLVTPDPEDANGSFWSGGKLHIKSSGITTLKLNTFSEYSSTTYGSLIAVGIYDATTGNVITEPSKDSYYLPMGDSTEDAAITFNQPAVTEITLDGSWLIPGKTYTVELVYAIIAGRPEEATLNGVEFQGVSSYRRVTTISLVAGSAGDVDFNGDGHPDILWENTNTGLRGVWEMNGYASAGWHQITTLSTQWRIAAAADFSGDGHPDLLCENTVTGERGVWVMNGYANATWQTITTLPTEWRIAAAADFNGDGHPDILWENTSTGLRGVWVMNGYASAGWHAITTMPTEWRIAAATDFSGDGHPDLVWENTSTGLRGVWEMNGYASAGWHQITTLPTEWRIAATQDFNDDDHPDIVWENTNTGLRGVWVMNGYASAGWHEITTMPTEWRIAN